ncbi:hypothetical protein ACVXHA_23895 [Escherichia coli]
MMRRLCCCPAHQQQVADICVTRRPAKMIDVASNSCVTPTSRRKAFCQLFRIPAPRSSSVKRAACMDRWW